MKRNGSTFAIVIHKHKVSHLGSSDGQCTGLIKQERVHPKTILLIRDRKREGEKTIYIYIYIYIKREKEDDDILLSNF